MEDRLPKRSGEPTYPLLTHWTSFLKLYKRPQLTNQMVVVRHSTLSTSKKKGTSHTNECTWERQYGGVHSDPNIPVNQNFLYKPFPNCMFYSSKHCHMSVDRRWKVQAEFFDKNFSSHFLHPTNFYMLKRTVTKSILYLAPFYCTGIILVWKSFVQHCYSPCWTCERQCLAFVNHCEYYHIEVNRRTKFQLERFAFDRLSYGNFLVNKYISGLVTIEFPTIAILCTSSHEHRDTHCCACKTLMMYLENCKFSQVSISLLINCND